MTDDALLDALALVLAPEPAEPAANELAAFLHAVQRHAEASTPPKPAVRPHRRARLRSVVAAAVVAGSTTVAGTAFALTGAALPAPLRAIAHAAGLPVHDPATSPAERAFTHLRAALNGGDPVAIRTAELELRTVLDHRDAGDRRGMEADAKDLLRRAEDLTGPNRPEPDSTALSRASSPSPDSPNTSTAVVEPPAEASEEGGPPADVNEPAAPTDTPPRRNDSTSTVPTPAADSAPPTTEAATPPPSDTTIVPPDTTEPPTTETTQPPTTETTMPPTAETTMPPTTETTGP